MVKVVAFVRSIGVFYFVDTGSVGGIKDRAKPNGAGGSHLLVDSLVDDFVTCVGPIFVLPIAFVAWVICWGRE